MNLSLTLWAVSNGGLSKEKILDWQLEGKRRESPSGERKLVSKGQVQPTYFDYNSPRVESSASHFLFRRVTTNLTFKVDVHLAIIIRKNAICGRCNGSHFPLA